MPKVIKEEKKIEEATKPTPKQVEEIKEVIKEDLAEEPVEQIIYHNGIRCKKVMQGDSYIYVKV